MSALVEAARQPSHERVGIAVAGPAGAGDAVLSPAQKVRLRLLLEAGWREQLAALTELSIEVHDLPDDVDRDTQRRLLLQLAGAHQRLRGLEEGMARLGDGRFGQCEACGRIIPFEHLEAEPATRHCAHCRRT